MKICPPSIKSRILLIDTTAESNRQLHAALGGVFDLVYAKSQSNDLDKIIEEATPRLVILELFDAAKEGFDLCREIAFKETIRDLAVIVIISAQEAGFMSTGYYMGASDYMTKPLIPAEVLARVGGQLELANSFNAIKDIELSFRDKLSLHESKKNNKELSETKVLVVDDCVESLKPMIDILSNFYNVYSATNGVDAIKLVGQHNFSLIILDVVMPEMNGYDVCQRLKNNRVTAEIPIIFLTGQSESRHEALGFSIGAVDYILKPASLSVLLARVRTHLLNARQHKKLSVLTYQDHLTKISNRRHFHEMYTLEHKRALRYKKPLSLLIVDIDQFKKYNDHYGHLKGDDCLKVVGQALVSCQRRPGDLASRVGGEEFIVLLPNNDESGALHVAQRILETIRGLQIKHTPDAAHPWVSVSIGLATMKPESPCTERQLIEVADQMLYSAKSRGRNCVHAAHLECTS